MVAALGGCGGTPGPTTEQFASVTLRGPGAQLPGGIVVQPGSRLVGAAFQTPDAANWQAVVQLDDAPLATYGRYLTALGYRGDVTRNPGCTSKDNETSRTRCSLAVPDPSDPTGSIVVDMLSVKGDVTGHYLLVLRRFACEADDTAKIPKQGSSLQADQPHSSPGPLRNGAQLPGQLSAFGGPYTLLEGSELIAVYGKGSATGGIELLLHVTAGADVAAVAARYAQQATQYPGETTTFGPRGEGGTTFTTLAPPGGAGGWQGTVSLVDNPGTDQDYLYYTMMSD